jgi:N-acetylneuraminic acid mutarotase
MKKKLSSVILVVFAAMFLSSCVSSTVTTDEGNWVGPSQISTLYGPARFYAVSFVINNYGYVVAGRDKNLNALGDVWRYDPNNNSWENEAPLPNGKTLFSGVGFSIGNDGYVGTGTDGYSNPTTSYYSDFYQYDATSNTWTQIANFPGGARYRATAFAIGTKGYVTCGMDSTGNYLKDMWCYDQTTGEWSQSIGSPGDKRVGAAAFVYNNEGYLIGGTNSGGQGCTQFYKFNPTSNSWITLRQITNATDSSFDDNYTDITRTDGVAFVANTKAWGPTAFVTTGKTADNGSPTNDTWAYDFANDTWQQRTAYERATRYGAVAFSLNGYGYVGTGWSGNGLPYDNFDIFYPDQAYNAND